MVWVCHFASAYFLPQKKWMTNEKTDETDEKQMKNINIIFDKKNICSYNISIATLEMLNNLLLLENLVGFDFPFSWLSAEGG